MTGVPENYGSGYYRSFLSEQGKAFYDGIDSQLRKEVFSGKTGFSVHCPATAASDCFSAYKALRDDHPEYFFLGPQCEFTRSGKSGMLKYPILYSADNIKGIQLRMRKCIYQIVQGTAFLNSTIEKEILVYRRIAYRLSYKDHDDVRDHNIVGPVLLSSGVCEGYNALLLLCFRRIGIPCIKVYGKSGTGSWHCWTIAWIDNIPVHCDVTWERKEGNIVCFDYFNLSDEQISRDHYRFRSSGTPVCTTDALNFYNHNNLSVNSFHDLRNRLKSDLRNGSSPILIHFNYYPSEGDYLRELQKAISAERLSGSYEISYHPEL